MSGPKHAWLEHGSGQEKCKRCGLYRVHRRRPGATLLRAGVVEFEVRDEKGKVIEVRKTAGSCKFESKQEDMLDLSRFE